MKTLNIAAFLMTAGCLLLSCASVPPPLAPQERVAKLDSLLKKAVEDHHSPGVLLAIRFADGSNYLSAAGLSDLGAKTPMTADKRFRIGSLTKSFVAEAALILVKEGKLRLEATVESILPGKLKFGNRITVEMLMNQSSALPNYTQTSYFRDNYFRSPTHRWTHDEVLGLFSSNSLLDVPGNKSYYSNSNYYTLGLIVESVSGMTLGEFLGQKILGPLGMGDTFLPAGDSLDGSAARGYLDLNQDGNFTADEDFTTQNIGWCEGAGGLVSTASDLMLWADELAKGTLVGPELQKRRETMTMPISGAPAEWAYGYGIATDGKGTVGHTGAIGGYSAVLYRYQGTTVVGLSNGFHTTPFRNQVADDLFDGVKSEVLGRLPPDGCSPGR